ncbi:MAG: FeoB-associated Cys-rich membrane protein [Clostridia bacterium]|nr:FeoB-associated Cys-rich membrane protein [Clostridia bacterium]
MLEWIYSNLGTIIVGGILILALILIICYMVRSKKEGKSSCGCGCGSCPMGSSCKSKK